MIPDTMGGIQGNKNISKHLASKYETLYNSVPYDPNSMEQIKVELARRMDKDQEIYVEVTSDDAKEAFTQLKRGNSDGDAGLHSDHLINAIYYLNRLLSILMNCNFKHAYMAEYLKVFTIISIPKNNRSSLIKSDTYRVIHLCSGISKLFDIIIFMNNGD